MTTAEEKFEALLHPEGLTARQHAVLLWIGRFTLAHNGLPPTVRDVMRGMGFRSPNATVCHLRPLALMGRVVREAGTSRGIRLAGVRWVPEAA